jgi:L-asparaginase II
MKQGEVLLEVVRNGMVESIHSGHLLISDSEGKTLLALGDLESPIYPRSAVKSIQSSAMVRAGLKLSLKQLALVCASHAGSSEHLEVAKSILIGAGLTEGDLLNTPDKPLGSAERSAWGSNEATALAANCSGKHAGMLATCVINGWDLKSYKDSSHPLQVAIIKEFETLTGEKITKIAVDGCGAPLFALSINSISRGLRTLIKSSDPVHNEVVSACRENPNMVSGPGRLPTILMDKTGLFAKDGAEGVLVIATKDGGTIIWKMSDGSQRGAAELAMASLLHLGIKLELPRESVLGGGQVVGEVRASKLVGYGK